MSSLPPAENPAAKPPVSALRVVMFVAVVLVLLVGALIVFWSVSRRLGLGLFLGASAIALLPVPFLVAWFLWLDRFDPPSSWRYPVFAFAWGAFVATAISLMVNTGGAWVFSKLGWREIMVAVWVAPVIEEVTKGLAPALLFWLRRREVVGIADAVMYAGLSATGFAMTENVLYLGGVYISGEQLLGQYGAVLGVVTLVVVRLGLTGFIHPLFTAMTGIGIGLAARTSNVALRIVYPLAGLVAAMLLHGTWNFMATLAQRYQTPAYVGYVYFGIALPLLFAVVVLSFWTRTAPGRAIRRFLPEYVRAGWFSPPEVVALATLRRRLWARRWARQVAGEEGLRAMRGYQAAATRLALQRQARLAGVRDWAADDEEQRLLAQIAAYREVFTGRDPSVPAAWWDGHSFQVSLPDGSRRSVDAPRSGVMPVPTLPRPPWGYPPYGYR